MSQCERAILCSKVSFWNKFTGSTASQGPQVNEFLRSWNSGLYVSPIFHSATSLKEAIDLE